MSGFGLQKAETMTRNNQPRWHAMLDQLLQQTHRIRCARCAGYCEDNGNRVAGHFNRLRRAQFALHRTARRTQRVFQLIA